MKKEAIKESLVDHVTAFLSLSIMLCIPVITVCCGFVQGTIATLVLTLTIITELCNIVWLGIQINEARFLAKTGGRQRTGTH